MDKQAVNLLVKKNVKEWKVNGGNVNLTFDSKALKELKKEMNTAVVIKMKQTDKKNLSARAGKIIGKRPIYDFSVTGIKKNAVVCPEKWDGSGSLFPIMLRKRKKTKRFLHIKLINTVQQLRYRDLIMIPIQRPLTL